MDKMPGKEDITWSTSRPEIDVLSNHRTDWQSIRPIMKDESSVANNIDIIEDMFRKQFRIDDTHGDYKTGIRLLSGDLKTWALIQSARALRMQASSKRADSLEWIVPILGLWHVRFNMIRLIHEIHWGGPREVDTSTLQLHADRLQRHQVVDPSKNFSLVERVYYQSCSNWEDYKRTCG